VLYFVRLKSLVIFAASHGLIPGGGQFGGQN